MPGRQGTGRQQGERPCNDFQTGAAAAGISRRGVLQGAAAAGRGRACAAGHGGRGAGRAARRHLSSGHRPRLDDGRPTIPGCGTTCMPQTFAAARHNQLIEVGADGQLVPEIAESWESDDGITWVFRIRAWRHLPFRQDDDGRGRDRLDQPSPRRRIDLGGQVTAGPDHRCARRRAERDRHARGAERRPALSDDGLSHPDHARGRRWHRRELDRWLRRLCRRKLRARRAGDR
jgi:hypothetical protein